MFDTENVGAATRGGEKNIFLLTLNEWLKCVYLRQTFFKGLKNVCQTDWKLECV